MASSHPEAIPTVFLPLRPSPGPPVAVGSASPGPAVGNGPHSGFKRRLHEQLRSALTTDRVERASEQQARAELTHLAAELSAQVSEALSLTDQEKVVEQVLDEVFGYGPLAPLMRDREISEILINGPRQLFIEKRGQLQACDVAFRDEHHLLEVVRRMLAWTGRRIDEKNADCGRPVGGRQPLERRPQAPRAEWPPGVHPAFRDAAAHRR